MRPSGRSGRDGTQSSARNPPPPVGSRPQLLRNLPAASSLRRLLCLDCATWQVPGIPVDRVDEEHPSRPGHGTRRLRPSAYGPATQYRCLGGMTPGPARIHSRHSSRTICGSWHARGITRHRRDSCRLCRGIFSVLGSRAGRIGPPSAAAGAGHHENRALAFSYRLGDHRAAH